MTPRALLLTVLLTSTASAVPQGAVPPGYMLVPVPVQPTRQMTAEERAIASAISLGDLAKINPLPASTIVKGSITAIDKTSFNPKGYVVKLDNVLLCELTWLKGNEKTYIEKKGNTLVFSEKRGLMNYGTIAKNKIPDPVFGTLRPGERVVVQGNLIQLKNGTVKLQGHALGLGW